MSEQRFSFYRLVYSLRFLIDEELLSPALEGLQGQAKSSGFERKERFHLSLVGFGTGRKIKETLTGASNTKKKEVSREMQSLAAQLDWDFDLIPEGRFRIAKDYPTRKGSPPERRESFVQLVRVPAMKVFYIGLSDLVGVKIEPPLAHVTLYTKGDSKQARMGIAIESGQDLAVLNPRQI